MSLTLIYLPPDIDGEAARLDGILAHALAGRQVRVLRRSEELRDLRGQRLLFALPLGTAGTNLELVRLLARLRREPTLLEGCTAALLVDGATYLYTKSAATELTLAADLAGCSFLGRPLVEGIWSLANFEVQAKNLGIDWMGAYRAAARELVDRLASAPPFPRRETPELLVLHASARHTSNTLDLWEGIRPHLDRDFICTEIGLRNGALSDCSGCPYALCLQFCQTRGCLYGGVMQEEICPAVRRCSGVLMLCPNYNDALSANLTAFINRLTALSRQTRLYDKALFAIVVSGYSGGDILARQLIAALNMNKSFYLPSRFALLETANDPGEAMSAPGIGGRMSAFAAHIRSTLLA